MSNKFDFISATDKPALLAFSTPEWLEAAKTALNELGFKVGNRGSPLTGVGELGGEDTVPTPTGTKMAPESLAEVLGRRPKPAVGA